MIDSLEATLALSRSVSCHKRSNCVQICGAIIAGGPFEFVAERVLPLLASLATDRVANVRLALAAVTKLRLLSDASPYRHHELVRQIDAALRSDSDRDVLRMIHDEGYEPPPYRSDTTPTLTLILALTLTFRRPQHPKPYSQPLTPHPHPYPYPSPLTLTSNPTQVQAAAAQLLLRPVG